MKLWVVFLFVVSCCQAGNPESYTPGITFSEEMIPEDALVDDVVSTTAFIAGVAFIAYLTELNDEDTTQEQKDPDHESFCTIL